MTIDRESCLAAGSDPGADLMMVFVELAWMGNSGLQRPDMHPDREREVGESDDPAQETEGLSSAS